MTLLTNFSIFCLRMQHKFYKIARECIVHSINKEEKIPSAFINQKIIQMIDECIIVIVSIKPIVMVISEYSYLYTNL